MTPSQRVQGRQAAVALGKAACYLGLFLGWQLLVSTVYSATIAVQLSMSDPAAMLDEARYLDAVMEKLMEISLVSSLLTLGSVVLLFKLRRKSLRQELWLHPAPGKILLWAAPLAFCLYWLVNLVLCLLPEHWLDSYSEAAAGLEQSGAVAFFATALVAPVVEEVVFRGLIFTRLQRALPGWAAVALSAAIFGLCHGELLWFCYAYILGVIFAMLARATGSILPGMLMHVVFNATNEVLAFFPDWEPGTAAGFVAFLLATAGTGLCALQLCRAVLSLSAPLGKTDAAAQPPQVQRSTSAAPEGMARWDEDSGMHHRFPTGRL